ncbi:MAG: class I SAM-dependent methyltransferase [Methanoregula sp.]
MGVICKICNNSERNKIFEIKEMMFGFAESFVYFECGECGCLQILEIQKDMNRYYPNIYYSFRSNKNKCVKLFLIKARDQYSLFNRNLLGKIVAHWFPNPVLQNFKHLNPHVDWNILDVGCGQGHLLNSLKNLGFKNLYGIDPFISQDINKDNLKIWKKTIFDDYSELKFDFIMFNHSFEHMDNHMGILKRVGKLLKNNGVCMIILPIKSDYIWNNYGVNWVQIDAPRHFYLHTMKSMEHLFKKSGMVVSDIVFNSTSFQFWGSEQYRRGIYLTSERSYNVNQRKSIFSKNEIKQYEKLSIKLNNEKNGDTAVFFIKKNSTL